MPETARYAESHDNPTTFEVPVSTSAPTCLEVASSTRCTWGVVLNGAVHMGDCPFSTGAVMFRFV